MNQAQILLAPKTKLIARRNELLEIQENLASWSALSKSEHGQLIKSELEAKLTKIRGLYSVIDMNGESAAQELGRLQGRETEVCDMLTCLRPKPESQKLLDNEAEMISNQLTKIGKMSKAEESDGILATTQTGGNR